MSQDENLLTRLEALARSAGSADERSCYEAQWAGAMARLGHVDIARAEISRLREANVAFSPRPTAWILIAEGLADHFETLSTAALDKFKRAHAIAVAVGDSDLRSFSSAWLSASEFLVGNYVGAVSHAFEAIANAGPTGTIALSRAHLVLANILYTVGYYPEAGLEYAKARRFAVDARDISMQSAALYNVAAFRIARLSLEDSLGQPPELEDVRAAQLELNSITNLDAGLGVSSLSAMVPLLRAQLTLVQQQWGDADRYYTLAIPEAATYGQLRWEPRFLAEHSHAKAMLGMDSLAEELIARALQGLNERIDADDLAACHARLSLSYAKLGSSAEAAAHSARSREFAAKFAARQEAHKSQLIAHLPPAQ